MKKRLGIASVICYLAVTGFAYSRMTPADPIPASVHHRGTIFFQAGPNGTTVVKSIKWNRDRP